MVNVKKFIPLIYGLISGIASYLLSSFLPYFLDKISIEPSLFFSFYYMPSFLAYFLNKIFIEPSLFPLYYSAGLIFGITVLIYYKIYGNKVNNFFLKAAFFLGMSVLGYYLAVYTFMSLIDIDADSELSILPVSFMSGIVGTFVLLIGLRILSSISLKRFIFIILLGGILGISLFLGLKIEKFALPILYIVWQTGMIFAISSIIRSQNKEIEHTTNSV